MKAIITATFIGVASLVSSLSANATDIIDQQQQCEVDMQGDLSFIKGDLRLMTDSQQEVLITASKDVFIEGKKIILNSVQQDAINEYYDAIERSIPQVIAVAKEGIKIANYALSEVLTGLLGDNSNTMNMLKEKLEQITNALDDHTTQNPNYITFDTRKIENDIGISKDWDAQYSEILEEIMPTAVGEFLMAMGRSMLSGEESPNNFEQRMENMGQDIEDKVTARAANIEMEAKRLCESMKSVDYAEQAVQQIEALKGLDMITVNKRA